MNLILDNVEQVTETDIKTAFAVAGLPIEKIVKSKLGGFYVYHPFGPADRYIKYTVIERGEGYVKKLRESVEVKRNFIDDKNLLEIAIYEGRNRQKWSK